jgi:hypothetical protein
MAHAAQLDSENTIRRLADYERVSGVLWIVLGIIQCLTIVLIIAGIWNIFGGRSRLKMSGRIRERDSGVPSAYRGIGGLILMLIINLIFGGVIGVVLVIFDFVVRDQVLSHAYLFE